MTAYLVTILTFVAISAIAGLALNLQWGSGGLVNFGLAGFYALGAYACALLTVAGLHWAFAMLAAAALCALASAAVALITKRLSEDYFAIVTLGFAEVVRLAILNEEWLTRGALGISGIERPFAAATTWRPDLVFLAFALVTLLAVFLVLELLSRSPFGRVLRATRDDDLVAATLGKDVLVVRLKAFAIGGAVIGIAGSVHAYYLRYVDPSQFGPILTAYAFMAVIVGGRGSNRGLLVGAGAIMILLEATRFLKDFVDLLDGTQLAALRLLMIGVGIILFLIFRPQGLVAEPTVKTSAYFSPDVRSPRP